MSYKKMLPLVLAALLLWTVPASAAPETTLKVAAHVSLDGDNGLFRVSNSLVLRKLTYQTLAVLSERYNGRRCSGAFGVGDNYRLAAFDNGYAGICCA